MRAILLVIVILGCSETKPVANDPPKPCALDADCAGRGYCTEAGICRRDCYVDEHCIGPGFGAQCNAQGKCIPPAELPETGAETDVPEAGDGGDEAAVEGGAGGGP